jgi:amidohydrolase
MKMKTLISSVALIFCLLVQAQVKGQNQYQLVDNYAKELEKTIIDLRRSFHQFPELSNREFETSKKIAAIMTKMGFQVETGVAKTGVIAVLDTGRPGPTVALRADIDGLPVTENSGVPFASTVRTNFLGNETGVMHACGHDAHTAMLIGAANIIKRMSPQLNGKVVFIFQPAEEGAPPGEEGGAELMVKEGVIDRYGIDVIFGQHIRSMVDVGTIRYKVGGIWSSANRFVIKIKGKQVHGSRPWSGVDPITVSAQVILGLQTIVSRQMDIANEPVVISVGKISGGVRNNIIPAEVEMIGTIRTLDKDMQKEVHQRIYTTVNSIAESAGATAEVIIEKGVPVTVNDAELTRNMLPSLYASAGEQNVIVTKAQTGAEDFSFFGQEVPGFYFLLGAKPRDISSLEATQHHTPEFYIDESSLLLGMKAMANLAIDYLRNNSN